LQIYASVSLNQNPIQPKTEQISEVAQQDTQANESSESEKNSSTNEDKKEESIKKAQERQVVAKLQARDSEVRAHEAAHLAAAGGIASGGASFTYQRGPDGKMYAVGGEVPISISGGSSPQETIKQMRQVAAAALAPADPSPQDYAVASSARSEEMRALAELRKEQAEAQKELGMQKYAQNANESDRGAQDSF